MSFETGPTIHLIEGVNFYLDYNGVKVKVCGGQKGGGN